MDPVERMASMFTNQNLGALLLFAVWPAPVQDVLRATTWLVLAVVLFTWMIGDVPVIDVELFDSFAPPLLTKIPSLLKRAVVRVMDVCLHVIPALWVGFPKEAVSIAMGHALLFIWYLQARPRIRQIYAPSVPAEAAMVGAGVASLVAVVALLC